MRVTDTPTWTWLRPLAFCLIMTALLIALPMSVHSQAGLDQDPDPAPAPCSIVPDKTASPSRILLGEQVTVTLNLEGVCPRVSKRVDVVLVIDRSSSMSRDRKLVLAKEAATTFVDSIDPDSIHVGLVAFDDVISTLSELSGDVPRLRQLIAGIQWDSGTNLVDSLEAGLNVLSSPQARPDAEKVIVFLTDGEHSVFSPPISDINPLIDRIRDENITAYTIGLGSSFDIDEQLLIRIAGDRARYFRSPNASELNEIFVGIAGRIEADLLLQTVTIEDEVPANMRYIVGTAAPAANWNPSTRILTWQLQNIPFTGLDITYRLEPLESGIHPTNVVASASFVDGLGNDGDLLFPVPRVEVLEKHYVYLPVLMLSKCLRRARPTDVVLIIDTSSSMREIAGSGRTKLENAVLAAGRFVDNLKMPADHVAVVGFDKESVLSQPLTGDRKAAQAGLDALFSTPGTQIHKGLNEARGALEMGRRPQALPVVILLTDGNHAGDAADVIEAANRLKAIPDTIIFTIGLGNDIQADLLRNVASFREGFYRTPDAEQLDAIYQEISRRLDCPEGS